MSTITVVLELSTDDPAEDVAALWADMQADAADDPQHRLTLETRNWVADVRPAVLLVPGQLVEYCLGPDTPRWRAGSFVGAAEQAGFVRVAPDGLPTSVSVPAGCVRPLALGTA